MAYCVSLWVSLVSYVIGNSESDYNHQFVAIVRNRVVDGIAEEESGHAE